MVVGKIVDRDGKLQTRAFVICFDARLIFVVDPDLRVVERVVQTGRGPSALVGSPEQILKKIERYIDMGIRAFIFSGYPHKEECELFARHILPSLKTCKLPVVQGRTPANEPVTPLTTGPRR